MGVKICCIGAGYVGALCNPLTKPVGRTDQWCECVTAERHIQLEMSRLLAHSVLSCTIAGGPTMAMIALKAPDIEVRSTCFMQLQFKLGAVSQAV